MDPRIPAPSSSQNRRDVPALADGYFHIDEMTLAGALATAAAYARLVKFYDLHNHHAGDWEPYFAYDETMVIASILALDLKRAEQLLERFLRRNASAAELPTRDLAKAINGWHAALETSQSEVGRKLHSFIDSVLAKLAEERDTLKMFLARPEEKTRDPALVKSNFYGYLKAAEMIRARAAQLLPESLKSQDHDPGVGLLVVAARLMQKLKARSDRYTQRHLDFYYGKVLRTREREAAPDSVYLVLQSSANARPVTVARGTEFVAGLDADKRDIVYVADQEVLVRGARVAALHTLFFNRNRWSSPENRLTDHGDFARRKNERRRQYPTHGWLGTVPAKEAVAVLEGGQPARHPLLGAPKIEADIPRLQNARLGFALASRTLLMGEGQREVSITLRCDENSAFMQSGDGLEGWVRHLASQINGGAAQTGTLEDDTFVKVFRNMFRISLTGEAGWIDVPEYIPLYSGSDTAEIIEKNCLVIRFTLRPEVAPVTAYSPEAHGENYGTALPVIRFEINPDGYLYPYGLLKNLALKEAVIAVRVSGVRNIMLYNNLGQLAPLGPFNPFGPIPVVGSWFIVGCAEAAGKQLERFDVDVEWGALPIPKGGFRTYYDGYEETLENEQVEATVSVLADGRWLHGDADNPPVVRLFDSGPDEVVGKRKRLSCSRVISYFKPMDSAKTAEDFAYTPAARNGFFKFTLTSPDYAFGHKEYPNALAKTLTYNARQKIESRHRAVPNEPYTPLVDSISVNYAARTTLRMKRPRPGRENPSEDKLIHLHPLGWEEADVGGDGLFSIVPRYEQSGNLFIGLRAGEMAGLTTLLFHLDEDSLPTDEEVDLQWFYLCGNRWKPLAETRVLSDSTQGFMTSGIVTLDLPADIGGGTTVMPDGYYWLRVSAERNLDKLCSLHAVYAQAVRATWKGDISRKTSTVLPVGSIKRARVSLPGIDAIIQPMPSFGGRAQESREHLRTRVAERLRHKNRALTAWDYERLILERFPEIYRVKCFPNMVMENDPAKRIRPGHVLIVPLPHLAAGKPGNLQPLLSGYLVKEVRDFVATLCPTFARVEVRNPVYEQIQVRCSVKFKKGISGGYYLNVLNQAISDFLSPWSERGYSGDFGWHVRQHELESFIQDLDYVDYVTHFSMLRISPEGEDLHDLYDSARQGPERRGAERKEITPKYPWSIAVPLVNHYIRGMAASQAGASGRGVAAGIGELEIGSTFIISAGE